jgi:N-acetylglucosaminyldiphosphoundecaprenol N-acetyl-beta-D-mannosaminyltransferase
VTAPARYPVLGVGVHAVDPSGALAVIRGWIAERQPHYVCLAAVHGIMECQRDPSLKAVYNAGGRSVYFHGGGEGVAEALAAEMSRRFPGLRVAGFGTPPFRPLSAEEEAETAARINSCGPDIVFVGLGCPKQERWMAAFRGRLAAPVLLGVGAAFDFHTGRVAQAPRALQSAGLEWLFRLLHEPRRLWYRYLVYNPLFVAMLALQALGVRRFRELS